MDSDSNYPSDYFFSPESSEFYQAPMAPYVRKYSENLYSETSVNEPKPMRKTSCDPIDFKVKFKTEICKYWQQQGSCPFQDQCAFAHGSDEIRNKTHLPQNYKTKKCKNFHENGYCFYGKRCQFVHQEVNSSNSIDNLQSASKNLDSESTDSMDSSSEKASQPSPNKYQIQLENIDKIWDNKSMSFQKNSTSIGMRPRLATFESLTNGSENESMEDLVI